MANSGADKLARALEDATRAIEKMTRSRTTPMNAIARTPGLGAGAQIADRGSGGLLGRLLGGGGLRGLAMRTGIGAAVGGAMAAGRSAQQEYDASAANYAITGNAQMGGNIQMARMSQRLADLPFFGASSGLQAANQVLGRTAGRLGSLADMARQGIEISDEMIQREASVVIEQEKRAQNVEARVGGTLGSAENLVAAAPDYANMTELATLVEIGRAIVELLPKAGGGS